MTGAKPYAGSSFHDANRGNAADTQSAQNIGRIAPPTTCFARLRGRDVAPIRDRAGLPR
ncbi:hypothetical protein HMPREF0591_2316 [Mycobacterium parascrofulaceum ATCC BAA-614]|uniref:Uncharacterized protein n=1 Tax=Mycobacterium parascrofulaceum ATCC BAA-614 TaxID=525368 RepID=D5P822_9MYCO|nr:hypothetical protein HMPREF0591_2316 [Mycobacterium parascrofulaceum ATCC BAA-614]